MSPARAHAAAPDLARRPPVALGTDPNDADTDGDGLPDDTDSLPTDPGATSGQLEALVRDAAENVAELDPSAISGRNEDAQAGRQNSLATRLRNAAKAIANGDYDGALDLLRSLRERVDGVEPVDDWVAAGPDQQALLAEIDLLIALAELGG